MIAVLVYLAAVVAANLSVVVFGSSVTVLNAFLFIGLDLSLRDRLHDAWAGRHLWIKMAALIAAGSAISWVINRDAGQIALASLVAFAAAGAADVLVYHLLRRRPYLQRINGSNVAAAAVDSLLFPSLAFGAILPAIILGQFAAKVAGGAIWSVVLVGWRRPAGVR